MNIFFLFHALSAISGPKTLHDRIICLDRTLLCLTMHGPISGQEAFPDAKLRRRSNLSHNEVPVYAGSFLTNWVEVYANDIFGRAACGFSSTHLSKAAHESLHDSYTFHQRIETNQIDIAKITAAFTI